MLDKMEDIRAPGVSIRTPRIKLPPPKRSGHEVIRIEDAGVTYNGKDWVFRHLDFRLERGNKAAVVGPNGMGKTTLLRALAGKLPLQEGSRHLGTNVIPGYQAQDFTDVMNPNQNVFSTARDGAVGVSDGDTRNVLGGFGFSGDAVDKQVSVLSGGEKVRLALARLLLRGPNFILLDEPTTHLDIPTRQALECALRDYQGTLCFVSHDIEFIRNVADTIYAIGPGGIVKYFGGYDYYRQKLEEAENGSCQTDDFPDLLGVDIQDEGANPRQLRRQKARRRQEIAARRKPLQRRAKKAEKEVETLHLEQSQLLERIQAGPGGSEMADVNRRLGEIQQEIDAATATWEEAELALEELG